MRRAQEALAWCGILNGHSPASVEELALVVREASLLRFGAGLLRSSGTRPLPATDNDVVEPSGRPITLLDTLALRGVVFFEPADQVVVVRSGTTIGDLNRALASEGQCLPLGHCDVGSVNVGSAMALNYPHILEDQCGTWRDWVLGLTVVLADGTIAKAGSKAVKNVAGYDVQKLFIGTRDSLGVVAEIILKTYPLRALPAPDTISPGSEPPPFVRYIQRVLRTDFNKALEGKNVTLADRASSTLWHSDKPTRFESDWLMATYGPPVFQDGAQLRFMQRAKSLFDPTHKLNPGVMGDQLG